MAGIFSHRYLWIVDVRDCGGVEKAVEIARDTGFGLIVKFHDGDPADDAQFGFQDNFAKIAEQCHASGIPIVAWGYCYGNKFGRLKEEAKAAATSLRRGAQGYVLDVETEWETPRSPQWAKQFMSILRDEVPDAEVGFTTFWNLRYHPYIPARALVAGGCCAVFPQVYYAAAGRSTLSSRKEMHAIMEEDFGALGKVQICPVGQLSPCAQDMVDFMELVGRPAYSFWLLDGFQDSCSIKILKMLGKCRSGQ